MTKQQINTLLSKKKTPIYVFDIPVLLERVRFLRRRLPTEFSLCYAMKANPFLTRSLSRVVDRIEACSPGEYQICRQSNVPPEQIVLSGVYKSSTELVEMVTECPDMLFTVESYSQMLLLNELAEQLGWKLRVLLRLTSGNQFGLDEGTLKFIVQQRDLFPNVLIWGIHFFSGTQKRSLRTLKKEVEQLTALLDTLETEYRYRARNVEYGPGFPVCYFQAEIDQEDAFLQECSELLKSLTQRTHITLELGRSIAASCGTYLTSVVDTKFNNGQNFAILDGGIHHLVYYGQNMAMKQPKLELLTKHLGEPWPWNLCGSLCTTNDILVKQLMVPTLDFGDVIAFEQAGAYSMTEGLSLFLSRDLPAVVLLREDGRFELVRNHLPTYPFNTSTIGKEL